MLVRQLFVTGYFCWHNIQSARHFCSRRARGDHLPPALLALTPSLALPTRPLYPRMRGNLTPTAICGRARLCSP